MIEQLSPLESDIDMKPIDKFFHEIGYGFHQIYGFIVSVLVILSDSAEISILSLCLNCITLEFDLTHFQRSLFGSVIFAGLLIGAFISHFSDKYGRKKLLQLSSFLVFFFGFLTSISTNFIVLLIFRVLVGIGIGIGFVVSNIYCAEITPIYNRGLYVNYINISFPLGEIIVMILCYYLLSNCTNWRLVVFLSGVPGFITFILLFFLHESPRYLLNQSRYDEAFKIIEIFGKAKNIQLSEQYKEQIIQNYETSNKHDKNNELGYSYLFSNEYRTITKQVWFLWISLSFIFYGFIYIIPQVLIVYNGAEVSESNVFLELIGTNLMLLLGPIFSGFLSEWKLLGRRNSISLCFIMIMVSAIMCLFIRNSLIFVFIISVKFFSLCAFVIVGVYTAEVYHTKIRSVGNSAAGMVTRFGGISAPFILEFSFLFFGISGPFIVFSILSLICFYVAKNLKVETNQMALDRNYI